MGISHVVQLLKQTISAGIHVLFAKTYICLLLLMRLHHVPVQGASADSRWHDMKQLRSFLPGDTNFRPPVCQGAYLILCICLPCTTCSLQRSA